MKKLFISQPMKGKTNEEIKAEREKAIVSVKGALGEDVEVIDNFFDIVSSYDVRPLWFLGKSLQLLSTADIAYFTKGWEDARGCKIEHQCAVEYSIPSIIEEHTEQKESEE
jgi:hypothetical protein